MDARTDRKVDLEQEVSGWLDGLSTSGRVGRVVLPPPSSDDVSLWELSHRPVYSRGACRGPAVKDCRKRVLLEKLWPRARVAR